VAVRKRINQSGVVWYVDLYLPDGTRYRKAVGTKKEAQVIERRIKTQIQEGTWGLKPKSDILFSELMPRYFEYTKLNRAASTHKINKYSIESNLVPFFGEYKLRNISQPLVEEFKMMRISEGMAKKTVNHELTRLSHILKMAIVWGYLDRNVVSTVEKFKLPERHPRYLSEAEIARLLNTARDSHVYPILVTALHTGMRKSELFNLKWEDVDFGQKTITIQSGDDWHTKNYRSRTIEMTAVLYETMRQHRRLHLELGVQVDYVFTYAGKQIRDLRRSINKAFQEADLADVTLHTLRHTFASQLVMAGVPLRSVQELMGHRSYETTLQYAHLSEEHVKKQVHKLPFANLMGKKWAQTGKTGDKDSGTSEND